MNMDIRSYIEQQIGHLIYCSICDLYVHIQVIHVFTNLQIDQLPASLLAHLIKRIVSVTEDMVFSESCTHTSLFTIFKLSSRYCSSRRGAVITATLFTLSVIEYKSLVIGKTVPK